MAWFNRTGMKCLPVSKVSQANGVCIHDWHAEILAVRAFNQFLLRECRDLALGMSSHYLRWREDHERVTEEDSWHGQPFTWKDRVILHMYCSEAPCQFTPAPLRLSLADVPSFYQVGMPAWNSQWRLKTMLRPGKCHRLRAWIYLKSSQLRLYRDEATSRSSA